MASVAIDSSLNPENVTTLDCSVGIMAYNEEANIANCLEALIKQRTFNCQIREIVVLASGCTDNTEQIVRGYMLKDPRMRLLVQASREGKAAAVNMFLRNATSDILVSVGADTVLDEPLAIQRLVEPFADPDVGMTGGRPVPVNDPRTLMGFAANLLWELHHQVALKQPKLGELTAYRRVFYRIPNNSAVDEANMEPLILGQGYRLRYVPEAVVRNRGPETVRDFVRQRRRIHAGHLKMRREQGYTVSTMSTGRILSAVLRSLRWDWHYFAWTPVVVGLEVYAMILGSIDARSGRRDHAIWEVVTSSKGPIR